MKVIQICGTNGAGKTTLVKNLLSNGDFERTEIDVEGVQKEIWGDGEITVIGKYNQANCCGVDAGNYSGDILLKTIENVIHTANPKVIVFEDVRFGGSFTFKEKLLNLAKRNGAMYILVNLILSPEISCDRVLNRSGNVGADYDAMISKARGVIRSSRKAAEIGAKVLFFDTGKNDKAAAWRFLLNVINS